MAELDKEGREQMEKPSKNLMIAHNIAIVLIFQTEFTESMLDILSHPQFTIVHHGWAGDKFSKWRLSYGWKMLF